MNKCAAYQLLQSLDHRQAAAWLAELTGVELDPATLAQACADRGTPAEIAVDGLILQTSNRQSVDAIGLRQVVEAHLIDPYSPRLSVTVVLDDGLLASAGYVDLREHSLRYAPAVIQAIARALGATVAADREIAELRLELDQERHTRQSLEAQLVEYREKPLDPRERRSATQIIAALAQLAGLDTSSPYKASGLLAHAAAGQREIPTEPTIVKWLQAASLIDPT